MMDDNKTITSEELDDLANTILFSRECESLSMVLDVRDRHEVILLSEPLWRTNIHLSTVDDDDVVSVTMSRPKDDGVDDMSALVSRRHAWTILAWSLRAACPGVSARARFCRRLAAKVARFGGGR